MTGTEKTKPQADPGGGRKALKPPRPLDGLEARRQAARDQVATLQAERDAATLDGRPFDHAALRNAEDEARALDGAAAELVRRDRSDAEAAAGERAATMKAAARALEDERRAAIEEAEAGARMMCEALVEAEVKREAVAQAMLAAGLTLPNEFSPYSQATRLSQALSATMTRVTGFAGGGNFGGIDLHVGTRLADGPWLDAEAGTTAEIHSKTEA